MRPALLIALLVMLITSSMPALAVPGLQDLMIQHYPQLKSGPLDSCITCHYPAREGFLNEFGINLKQYGNSFDKVASLDADEDGQSNHDELSHGQFPASRSDDPDLFIFNNKMGQIKFNHRAHISDPGYQINGNCALCHEGPKFFQKKYDDDLTIKNDAHSICWKCHKSHKETRPQAPQVCKDCHNRDIKGRR